VPEPLTVPPNVLSAVRTRWPEHTRGWPTCVETGLLELCERYAAKPRQVLPARYGFVVAADNPTGGIVLRASPDPHGPAQAEVTLALAKLGAGPTVHETIVTGEGTWTILDEVRPGTPLAMTDLSTMPLEALAAPLAAINGRPAPVSGMPSIIDWLRSRLLDDELTDLAPGTTVAPTSVRRDAIGVLDELASAAAPGLCHGDASPWNILAYGETQWTLIDPRGMNGEVSYDVAVLAFKMARHKSPALVAARLARAVGVDPERAQAWVIVASAARV
jgi:streptomycin 6-kinase